MARNRAATKTLRLLMDGEGLTAQAVAQACGLSFGAVAKIVRGEYRQRTAKSQATAARVLSYIALRLAETTELTLEDVIAAVPATPDGGARADRRTVSGRRSADRRDWEDRRMDERREAPDRRDREHALAS